MFHSKKVGIKESSISEPGLNRNLELAGTEIESCPRRPEKRDQDHLCLPVPLTIKLLLGQIGSVFMLPRLIGPPPGPVTTQRGR